MAQDVDSTIGFEGISGMFGGISEKEETGGAGSCFDHGQVGGIAFDGKDHVAGGEAHGGVRIGGTIVKELGQFGHGVDGALGLFGGEFADGRKKRGVDGARVVEERAQDLKDAKFVGSIEGSGVVRLNGILCLHAIVGALPRVGGMLGFGGCGMLKPVERAVDVPGHRDITSAGNVIPFQCQAATSVACPIGTDLVGSFEGGNEMLGVGVRGVTDAEVVNNQAENNISRIVTP